MIQVRLQTVRGVLESVEGLLFAAKTQQQPHARQAPHKRYTLNTVLDRAQPAHTPTDPLGELDVRQPVKWEAQRVRASCHLVTCFAVRHYLQWRSMSSQKDAIAARAHATAGVIPCCNAVLPASNVIRHVPPHLWRSDPDPLCVQPFWPPTRLLTVMPNPLH